MTTGTDKDTGDRLERIEGLLLDLTKSVATITHRLDEHTKRLATIENSAGTACKRITEHHEDFDKRWNKTFLVQKLLNNGIPAQRVAEKDMYENAIHYLVESLHYGGRFVFWQDQFADVPKIVGCDNMVEWDDPQIAQMLSFPGGVVPPDFPRENDEERRQVGENTNYRGDLRVSAVPPAVMLRYLIGKIEEISARMGQIETAPTTPKKFPIVPKKVEYTIEDIIEFAHVFGDGKFTRKNLLYVAEEYDFDIGQNPDRFMKTLLDDGLIEKLGFGLYRKA